MDEEKQLPEETRFNDKSLKKDQKLKDLFKRHRVSELEALLIINEIIRKLKFILKYSKNKYLYCDLNSSNITLTRFLDIMINYVNSKLYRKTRTKIQIIIHLSIFLYYIIQK